MREAPSNFPSWEGFDLSTFRAFYASVKDAERRNILQGADDITQYDWLVCYATCMMWEAGKKEFTVDELWYLTEIIKRGEGIEICE